jgi:hypothetical protein
MTSYTKPKHVAITLFNIKRRSLIDSFFPYIFIFSSKWDVPLQIVNKLQPFHETKRFIPTRVALIWKVTPRDVVDKYRRFGIYLQNYKV